MMTRSRIKYAAGCLLFAGVLITSCDSDSDSEVFENLDAQNIRLVQDNFQAIPNQYVVTFHKGTLTMPESAKGSLAYKAATDAGKNQILSEFGKLSLSADDIQAVYAFSIEGFAAVLNEDQLQQLGQDPRVKSIEQDYLIIMAPPPGRGPGGGDGEEGGTSPAEETPYGISRVGGGATYTGSGVAYILDSGIDLDHEDLNVDASRGFNAITRGKDAESLDDLNGHGTHVAGTVAAIDNEVGVIGVAAGATVVPVKVLDRRGSGSYSGVISGVDFVGANGSNGDVANMSLGGPVSQALDDAVVDASQQVAFSLAAGNSDTDANGSSPARANGPNIYTVSAMDSNDDFAYFSNYGNPPVDYCAPGVSIKSTWNDGGYNTISGTSMAAPHVCGLLLWGNISSDGTVNGDPDGNADPIAHR